MLKDVFRTRGGPGVARLAGAACLIAILCHSEPLYLSAAGQTPSPPQQVSAQQPIPSASTPATTSQRELFNRYCISCHNAKLRTAGLVLDTMDTADVSKDAAAWEKVLRKVRARAMPPAGSRRPDEAAYVSLTSWLESTLDRAALANPNPGRILDHRLNRAEYGNVIRDLLAVEIDSQSLLPGDDLNFGFDNIADVLSLTPALLARYMSVARRISGLAVGSPSSGPIMETFVLPPMHTQGDRNSEDLPFGTRGGTAVRYNFPLDGEYVIKIRLREAGVGGVLGMAEPHQLDVRVDGVKVKQFTVGGRDARGADLNDRLEVRFLAKAGPRDVAVTFVQKLVAPEGPLEPHMNILDDLYCQDCNPGVDRFSITGPFNAAGSGDTPSRRKIFVCRPATINDEGPCVNKILTSLARRAYRRPVTAADLQTLLSFYGEGRKQGGGLESGIERALERILVDPEFLFRAEREPAGIAPDTNYRISDLELASRMSFFLWSSIPDDELLDVAARGRLKDPAVLERQVRRMLADPRAAALSSNFLGQWFQVRQLRATTPDPAIFLDYDEDLRESFSRETELLLESQLREDRSIFDLLTANYTFLNERLARHYGIPNIYGTHFRRVTVGSDRAGILGQGSVLTVTSYANRTSPVLRGKWVLDNIFNTPPPPPPNGVPALKEDNEEGGKGLTVRERLERHRRNPVCATCHAPMDPLGFALENFDAIGAWRTTDSRLPVDATGVLPNGTKIDGISGLRDLVLRRGDEFVITSAEKLLTYALGRGLEYYDLPIARAIVRGAAANHNRWSALVLGVVKSTPFQMRRSSPRAPVSATASRR